MRLLFNSLLLLGCVLGFVACEDDEKTGNFPALYTDMLCVATSEDGTLTTALLDNGEAYDVSAQRLASDARDTILRCRASYTLNDGRLELYGIAHVFSDEPRPVESLCEAIGGVAVCDPNLLPRDPVKLISMWKSGGYINLH
ncbi:MAG: hypothetical protein K2H92_05115, partial [Bacteroidaceae bacterium]|nr:hypothetical protein [Bacteroidaceae bacterium]